MKKYEISEMTPILKKKICLWDRYQGKNVAGYERFLTYLHGQGVKKYFEELEINDALDQLMGEEKEHKMFVLKEDGEIKSFVSTSLEYGDLSEPKLYIQSVATHPQEQGKGYATKLMVGLLKKPNKYFGLKPKVVYGLVKNTNGACQSFFQKLGKAKTEPHDETYDIISVKLKYDENGMLQKEK